MLITFFMALFIFERMVIYIGDLGRIQIMYLHFGLGTQGYYEVTLKINNQKQTYDLQTKDLNTGVECLKLLITDLQRYNHFCKLPFKKMVITYDK